MDPNYLYQSDCGCDLSVNSLCWEHAEEKIFKPFFEKMSAELAKQAAQSILRVLDLPPKQRVFKLED